MDIFVVIVIIIYVAALVMKLLIFIPCGELKKQKT